MTSATVWGWYDRRPQRIAIAAAATLDACWLGWMTRFDAPNDWVHADPGPLFGGLARSPWLHGMVVVAAVVALWTFAWGRRPVLQGGVALGLLFVVYETNAFQTGFLVPEMHVAGSALLGWVVGRMVAAGLDPRAVDAHAAPADLARWANVARDRLAEAGAIAGVVANYVVAALSKWLAAGWDWDGRIIRRLLFAFRRVDDTGPIAALGDAVRTHAWLPDALAGTTLLTQSAAVLLLVGPRLRVAVALLLAGMHVAMTLTARVIDPQLLVLVGVLCLPWPRWLGRSAVGPTQVELAGREVRRTVALAVGSAALLGTCAWTLPIREAMTVRFGVSQTPWDRSRIAQAPATVLGAGRSTSVWAPRAGAEVLAWLAPIGPGAAVGDAIVTAVSAVVAGGVRLTLQGKGGETVLLLHAAAIRGPPAPATTGEVAIFYEGSAPSGAARAQALAAVWRPRTPLAGLASVSLTSRPAPPR
ncbi:MAG: hypothetical protein EXR79_15555 [Myxococcales bacterium]|nr:hypothetical protein [Myxococcales bacterium]